MSETPHRLRADFGIIHDAPCDTCVHRRPGTLGCDAFDVIPAEIMQGRNPHTAPYPGDHGVRYEPVA